MSYKKRNHISTGQFMNSFAVPLTPSTSAHLCIEQFLELSFAQGGFVSSFPEYL